MSENVQESAMTSGTPPSRNALGRGLAALIPGAPPRASSSEHEGAESDTGLRMLAIERIQPNPAQPRKTFEPEALAELADSIQEHGMLQPIVVRRANDGYQIVAGERRWRAAAKAGLREVPALVKDFADHVVLAAALVENVQRRDLDPLEEADAYRRLIDDYRLTQEHVAQAVGKSRVAISNSLRLLKLPEPVLDHLAAGRLSAGHARALMTLKSPKDQARLAEDAIRRKLSVRETEHRARTLRASEKKAQSGEASRSPAELALEEKLQRALGTKVRLHHRAGKGRIELSFHSLEHLDDLVE
ncbi:MAG: ParB/RepB/Spo0J family partition protein, partial [Myxococcota bacterium]